MQNVKALIEAKGCKLEYLPPYSPDFNPIEYSFPVLKKAVKNQYQPDGDQSPSEFGRLILKAATEVVIPQIARNQFRHCKIRIE
jgi:transposase